MNVLHIGLNSSIPIIFNTFCKRIYLLYNPKIYRVFKEQDFLPKIESNVKDKSLFGFFKRIFEIKRITKEKNIDLIFINRKDDMIASKLAFLWHKKKPIILGTFHNPQVWQNDRKVKIFCHLMNICLDGHLSMASFAYNKLLKLGYDKNKILFFQNYILFEDFSQKNSYEYCEKFKICYSGTIDDRKNEMFTLEVINNLKEKYNLIYDIYGPFTDDSYKKKILNYIQRNNLECVVEIHPRLSPLEERAKFLEHDLYFSSSRAEMCPLNVLNAKACAMPIIVADSFGQQDLITDGLDGYKFSENNICDATIKLEKLITDKLLREKFGRNAYKSVSETNSYKKAAEDLKKFINKIYETKNCSN